MFVMNVKKGKCMLNMINLINIVFFVLIVKGELKSIYMNMNMEDIMQIWDSTKFLLNQINWDIILCKMDFKVYDFVLTLDQFKYSVNKILFIKIIPNFFNAEICMNNAVKWQIKKSFNDKFIACIILTDSAV